MSYWSNHPEKLDEITVENLPDPWQTMVLEGEISLYDVPNDIFSKAMEAGVADYWGSKIDEAEMKLGPDR